MNTTCAFSLQPTFDPGCFPDLRLFDRAFLIQLALAENLLHRHPFTEASRKGFSRFLKNDRIDADELLKDSFQYNPNSLSNYDVILSCEDTTLVRYSNLDAGRLMSVYDTGYVVHYAAAVSPGTGIPLGWMGAIVLNRINTPYRNQDHRNKPMNERESIKWLSVRDIVHENAKNVGFTGLIISINDREGDSWSSLTDAIEKNRKILTRSCQDRKIENSDKNMREFVHKKLPEAEMKFTVSNKSKSGKVSTREALVEIRWTHVQLSPPKNDKFAKKTPLNFCSIEILEKKHQNDVKNSKATCSQIAMQTT